MLDSEMRSKLVQAAIEAQKNAYTPYSHYAVGAALLTDSGKVVTGVNVENAVYPLTLCAERVAVFKAVSEGEKNFQAIAVATRDGGTPCGSCRQVLSEFGRDIIVVIADNEGQVHQEAPISQLLPNAFGPSNLAQSEHHPVE